MLQSGGVTKRVAARNDLWRCAGWIAFAIAAAVYYGRYSKTLINLPVYAIGAECFWNGQAFLECAPEFTYPPALALLMMPLVPVSPETRLLIWYLISVAATVICVALSESLVKRLYPAAADESNLGWIRALTVLLSLKFILSVLNYQAYDTIVLCVILFGLWSLAAGRAVAAGGALALAAAVKATPLIFLPYLLVKRRFLAAAAFIAVFALLCALPDLVNALKGTRSDYFATWVEQIAGPALTPGGSSPRFFWHGWMGQTLDNLSLRGVINRLVREPLFELTPRTVLFAAYAVLAAVMAILLLLSPRQDELIAADGAVLLIGMLAFSPITSRYHFIALMLPYAVVIAATICDHRMRTLGIGILVASFVLVTGTSNDVTGQALAEYAHAHGFLLWGTLILLIPLGAVILSRRPALPQAAWNRV
jgi:hypothetical protein